jgi:hypothetical protein
MPRTSRYSSDGLATPLNRPALRQRLSRFRLTGRRGGSLRHGPSTRTAVRIGPAIGDGLKVPAQQSRGLDEDVPETPVGEQSYRPRQDPDWSASRDIGRRA